MKVFLQISTFLLLCVTAATSFANRLDDDVLRGRCYTNELTHEQCAQLRDYAFYTLECITEIEYNYANTAKLAPICTPPAIPGMEAQLVAVCPCGCFEEGTQISAFDLTRNRDVLANIEDVVHNYDTFEAYSVTASSTLSSLSLEPKSFLVTTEGEEPKPLIVVHTESGKRIGLSSRHGVLLSTGKMTIAADLSVGDILVQENGSPDAIVSLERGAPNQMVYNVLTNTDSGNENGHLIVAEGLIMGDLYWQNILDSEFRRFKIRQ